MREILIIGGNRFVGKLVSEDLYKKGYNVNLLNRSGNSPVDCNVIKVDRNEIKNIDISPEIIIDMCAYDVSQIEKLFSSINTDRLRQYILISSIASQYSFFGDYGKRKAERY